MKGAKTGGRKKGSKNIATQAKADAIAASGLTPLDYLLGQLRDENNAKDVRMQAAKDAAPYVHPKLASFTGQLDMNVLVEIQRFSADSPAPSK